MTPHGITSDVFLAAQVLEEGGIIGMPTETVYGLAALARNEEAVHRVFDTKGRPRNHPLIVHLSPESDIHRWGIFNETAQKLADALWPGPLTLLVPRTSIVPDWVTGGRDTVAIRIPQHPIAQQLLSIVNDGVVAPSANRFGKVSPTSALHVASDLGETVDLILDGGRCEVGVESTIVECTETFQILRPGQVSESEISQVAERSVSSLSGPSRAPGMLESHYAPNAKVVLVDSIDEVQAVIGGLEPSIKNSVINYDDANEYAENLYDDLRRADANNVAVVIAVRSQDSGIGVAVNDRLAKAAALR